MVGSSLVLCARYAPKQLRHTNPSVRKPDVSNTTPSDVACSYKTGAKTDWTSLACPLSRQRSYFLRLPKSRPQARQGSRHFSCCISPRYCTCITNIYIVQVHPTVTIIIANRPLELSQTLPPCEEAVTPDYPNPRFTHNILLDECTWASVHGVPDVVWLFVYLAVFTYASTLFDELIK